jgi:cell shape-determining protein MreC
MYQFRDKKQINQRKNLIRTIILVGIFLVLSLLGFLAWTGKIFNFIGRPIWKAENTIVEKVTDTGYLVRNKSSVFKENNILKEENATLRSSILDYQLLKSENDQLKEVLGRLPTKHDFILATIITKPNRSPYDTIFIDVGSDLGITEGMEVIALGNVPVGEISKVYSNDSLVMLYSNPGQVTEGVLSGSNASVELTGRGGGNFEMTIPLDLPSESGMMVTLPKLENEVVAIIDAVISTPTDPVKKVLLHSPANVQNLKWVQIKRN